MDARTYGWLQAHWQQDLPDVPWPFDLSAHPQDVVAAMGAHLAVRTRRPGLVVTQGDPLVVGPPPCNPPPSGPTKTP